MRSTPQLGLNARDFGGARAGCQVDVDEHAPANIVGGAVGRLDDGYEHAEDKSCDEHRGKRGDAGHGIAAHRAGRLFQEEARLHVVS